VKLSGDGGSRTRSFSVQTSCSAGRASSPGGASSPDRARAAGEPPPERSHYPFKLRLDEGVSRGECSSDPVTTVPHQIRVAVAREAHGRRVVSQVEPQAVSLDRRPADRASAPLADPNLGDRHPDRLKLAGVRARPAPAPRWLRFRFDTAHLLSGREITG
jgi:hypothetical protein